MGGNGFTHPTILASHLRDDGIMDGCNHYRFRIAFEELRRKVDGGIFDWAPMGKVREWANSNAEFKPTDYDILLLPRHRPLPYLPGEYENIPDQIKVGAEALGYPTEGKSHLLDMVRILRSNQSIVLEYDDDYFTNSRDLKYQHYDLFHELVGMADAIIVSTDYLAKVARRYATGVPVYVLENSVNWDEWQNRERFDWAPEDHIVIGLTGSPTHGDDWLVLKDVMPRVLKENGNVTFVIGGWSPEYFRELVETHDRAQFTGPVVYDDYPSMIRQFDITLCPVKPDDEFNFSKSAIKAIEGLAAGRELANGRSGGSVPITSKLYYYQRVTGGNKRGLSIDHTPEAWYDAITTLIRNNELRMRLAQKGRGWVYKNRSIERNWQRWWAAYREIHRRKR